MARARVVATCNVQKDMPLDQAEAAVEAVLVYRPGVLALQEWVHARDVILRRLSRRGYTSARSALGGGPLVVGQGIGIVRTWGVRLARREFVGQLAARKSRLPESIAGVFLCHDDATGADFIVINFHLTAEVQFAGRYRRDPAHLLRVMRHRREVRRLERIVRRQQAKGRDVFAPGDSNFEGLQIKGLRSCWDGREGATLGKRAVDIVFADTNADAVRTVSTGSDHRAVVVTYKEG